MLGPKESEGGKQQQQSERLPCASHERAFIIVTG
jgi:hypothetical protein